MKLDENVYYNAATLMGTEYIDELDDRTTVEFACEAISVGVYGYWRTGGGTDKYKGLMQKLFDDEREHAAYLENDKNRIMALLFMYEITKGE